MPERPFYAVYLAVSCQSHASGGYATVLVNQRGEVRQLTGGRQRTIPNRLGLIALIEALTYLQRPGSVTVYTTQSGAQETNSPMILAGEAYGWTRNNGAPPPKADLYAQLCPLLRRHYVRVVMVSRNHDRDVLPAGILYRLGEALQLAQQAKRVLDLPLDPGYEADRNAEA
jgi:ribonuclease HI